MSLEIRVHPVPVSAREGTKARFFVEAISLSPSSQMLSYQWQKVIDNLMWNGTRACAPGFPECSIIIFECGFLSATVQALAVCLAGRATSSKPRGN